MVSSFRFPISRNYFDIILIRASDIVFEISELSIKLKSNYNKTALKVKRETDKIDIKSNLTTSKTPSDKHAEQESYLI